MLVCILPEEVALSLSVDENTYRKLKQIAEVYMRSERQGHTLSPTALVNEAYLRIYAETEHSDKEQRTFLAFAAHKMRQILVDHARARNALKRGGGVSAITLDETMVAASSGSIDILSLNDGLEKLALHDPEKVRIVEMRYFSGMTLEAIAVEMGLSVSSVKRKWTAARAWLYRELVD